MEHANSSMDSFVISNSELQEVYYTATMARVCLEELLDKPYLIFEQETLDRLSGLIDWVLKKENLQSGPNVKAQGTGALATVPCRYLFCVYCSFGESATLTLQSRRE
jgi:hypothetical protein